MNDILRRIFTYNKETMDTVQIKVEPTEFIDVNNIKTEPLDTYDTGPQCDPLFNIEPDYLKVEIKEELEDDGIELDNNSNNSNEEDCTMSPSPPTISIPNSPDSTCRVEILEQPLKKIRFRYLSELQGTPHGPVLGERSSKNHKTYPKARLVGYDAGKNETIKMRCWLVDRPNQMRGHERPHCHNLVVRRCNPKPCDIVAEPHEVVISRDNNYTAEFENMVVLHSVQKNLEKQYMDKTTKWTYRVSSPTHMLSEFSDQSELSSPDKKRMRETIKSINKNEVYLYFEAFVELRNSVVVLASAISNPIRNLKNPVSGDLKICKVVNSFGTCDGDTEVCLFVEKVPQDIKVKFYNDNWTEYISPDIIHRNFAVSFRTPKFDFGIEEDTRVQFCLYRESDGCESNPMEFTYRPSEYSLNCNRKRKRINNSIVPSPQPSTLNTVMFGNGNSQDVDMPIKREIDLNTQVRKPKIFRVSRQKFNRYLKLMKSKGYVLKSIT